MSETAEVPVSQRDLSDLLAYALRAGLSQGGLAQENVLRLYAAYGPSLPEVERQLLEGEVLMFAAHPGGPIWREP